VAKSSSLQRAWYRFLRFLSWLGVRTLVCFRSYRSERIPDTGPVVILSNHQSHFDPVLVGAASRRPLSFLARKTLFRGPFGLLIRSLNAIPLDREGAGVAGLREVVRRLKDGEATLVFPEGTRTHDGQIGPFRPGFGVLVRRSKATIVPVGIAGAYQAWPRSKLLPRAGRVTLHVGRPISPTTTARISEDELMARVRRRIHASVRIAECLR
jgi:1-acyl-sn-glycerol-3-phosphate acyltransferase